MLRDVIAGRSGPDADSPACSEGDVALWRGGEASAEPWDSSRGGTSGDILRDTNVTAQTAWREACPPTAVTGRILRCPPKTLHTLCPENEVVPMYRRHPACPCTEREFALRFVLSWRGRVLFVTMKRLSEGDRSWNVRSFLF